MHIINRTGLFPKEYKTWILHGDGARKMNNFVSFKSFWENAVQIAAFTASQHGYGIATMDKDTLAQSLTDVVLNFGTAYIAT
jgi:hypothetical protein